MNLDATRPITYAISSGEATDENIIDRLADILGWIRAAVDAGISLIQLREKKLSTRVLFELAQRAAEISQGSSTAMMINDRADIASAAGADGVHLTSRSIPADVVRKSFPHLLIGVSTHSAEEIEEASSGGADLVVFGPVFPTPGKGHAKGLNELGEICRIVPDLTVIGLGGIDHSNFHSVLDAGAAGVAGIRAFGDNESLRRMLDRMK